MRNRWYDKVLNFVVALILLFGALIFIAMPLSAVRSFIAFVMTNLNGFGMLVFSGVGVIMLVLFAYVLAGLFSKKSSPMPTSVNVKVSEIGSVDITIGALDSLVLKSARAIPAVKDCKAFIVPADDGAVNISLTVSLMPEANIPEVTAKLQEEVKKFVESHTGVNVREIQVVVESTGVNPQARVQ
ncbi:MAG: alkaline shock response membrane anchor protein AmaP [Clostridia bacterium]|nr:alkaline shock response membrane anchor protein AmaP [Clostridia bacterium]